MKYQIIVDSGSDLKSNYLKNKNIGFSVVPLTINIGDKQFVDNEKLNINEMLEAMHAFNGKTSTACPSPESFLDECKKADVSFIVTITSGLSGTYNSALLAAKELDDKHKVHVIDSRATCGSEILIVNKLVEMIEEGLDFNTIVKNIEEFRNNCKLLFVLQKFDNLIANGRMSKVKGFIANMLSIKLICEASPEGEIRIAEKTFGINSAYKKMVASIGKHEKDFSGRTCYISHCNGIAEASIVKEMITSTYNFKSVEILPMNGLASYYALEKGIIVCF